MDAVHRKETRSTIDQRLRPPWTMPVNQAQWRPMATTWQRHSLPHVRASLAQIQPISRPNRPSSDPIHVDR